MEAMTAMKHDRDRSDVGAVSDVAAGASEGGEGVDTDIYSGGGVTCRFRCSERFIKIANAGVTSII